MNRSPDVVIIGGGVIGVSVQYALAEAGIVNTKLLEMGTLASGSTGRSQAILRAHYSNEVTANLAWHSLKIFREFSDIVGTTSGYKKTGYLLAVGGDDAPAMTFWQYSDGRVRNANNLSNIACLTDPPSHRQRNGP